MVPELKLSQDFYSEFVGHQIWIELDYLKSTSVDVDFEAHLTV